MQWFRKFNLALLGLGLLIVSQSTLMAEENQDEPATSDSISHSFLLPENTTVTDVRIVRVGDIPVVAGRGSDGRTYYSPELFPNFQPSEIERIGKVGNQIVMISKEGRAFKLTFDGERGLYGAASVEIPSNEAIASREPNRDRLIVPSLLNPTRPFPRFPVAFAVHRNVDNSHRDHCSGSTTFKRGQARASGQWAYNNGDAARALRSFRVAADTYNDFISKFFIAQIHYTGEAGEKDYRRASESFQRLLDGGIRNTELRSAAHYALGVMKFYGGNGIEANHREAVAHLQRVVDEKGKAPNEIVSAACLVLAHATRDGLGTDQSLAMSQNYLSEMVAMGGPLKTRADLTLAAISEKSSGSVARRN